MKDGDTRAETEVAVFSFLERGFSDLDLAVSHTQILQLARLVSLLEQWAPRINLTGYRTALDMAGGLVLDAAALASAVPEIGAASRIADLGTGAGFPGLPLAILFPAAEVHLVDSRKKRNHFQREAKRRLALERADPILGRSDEIEPTPCDLVIAQAMTDPDHALELMAQWASTEARLVLPASENATPPSPPSGWTPPERRLYQVPLTRRPRQVWILRPEIEN